MFTRKTGINLITILALGLLLISACQKKEEISVVPTAENTATSEPSATPTDEPTETPEPTDTATPTPTPTDTPEPTATATSTSTPTPEPSATPTAAPTSAATAVPATTESGGGASDFPLPLPVGVPATEWNGLPIMPGAIAGSEGSGSYSYTTAASVGEIQNYYQTEMPLRGWSILAVGEGQNGATVLIFQMGAETASVSIFTVDASTRYVFLVR